MTQLHEQFRPSTWSEVLGQDKVLAKINTLRKRGLSGRAYWITGQSGTGKTSIARLLASEVAGEWGTVEMDAGQLTADSLRDLEQSLPSRSLSSNGGPSGRAVIVNESHGLRADICRRLLVTLESVPSHAVWIFTTTSDNHERWTDSHDDAAPLLSRCIPLALTSQGLSATFASHLVAVAERAGLGGLPPEQAAKVAAALVKSCKNNLRAALQAVDGGALMAG